ncbi:PTS sugar transporter subunit IIA [candidate division KSB1 bacterium]|nr:PTS sugar transporter subunit IIA [candidate division KSB1 bacterium]RQW10002.1 MAG: PTS sugar transporter subunit IIA [candidate division KSB1 bacterium]
MQRHELRGHLREALFIPSMKATTKDQALEELLDLFVAERYVRNKQLVLEMLRQREMLGSTSLGKGVAVPHGRTTATADVIIAFGRSEKGVHFDASDEKPVTLFFMVIAPHNDEGNIYLPILGSLVTILKDTKKRNALNKVTTFAELVALIDGE